jgi:PPOX class probable F420-dependent enzyme
MKIPRSVRELLPKAPLAHLTTLNSDGSPQVTVVWVGIENEEFVIGHLATHKKVRNVQRDSRVALSLLGDKTNAQGLREYVVIYGNARVTEGAVDLLQRLAGSMWDRVLIFRRLRCGIFRVTSLESRRPVSPGSVRGVPKAPSKAAPPRNV